MRHASTNAATDQITEHVNEFKNEDIENNLINFERISDTKERTLKNKTQIKLYTTMSRSVLSNRSKVEQERKVTARTEMLMCFLRSVVGDTLQDTREQVERVEENRIPRKVLSYDSKEKGTLEDL